MSYTKIRRIWTLLFVLYIVAQAYYVCNNLNKYNDRINSIRMINNSILESLTDINRELIYVNKQYYDFSTGRGGDLGIIVELMTSTIKKTKSLKANIIKNHSDFKLSEIDALLANAKLLKMIAYSYHNSWKRSRTGSTTLEMDEALRLATDKPMWTSLDLVTDIRDHVESKAEDVMQSLKQQKNIFIMLLAIQVVAFLLVVLFLDRLLKWHIKRLLKMADSISKGNFNEKINVIGDDAIGNLAVALNDTADQLAVMHANLEAEKNKAEAANESKSKFLSNISHEIRTPLNSISGFSELALESDSLYDAKQNVNFVLSESEHLLQLINTILDHAKIEAGKLQLENLIFDLHQDMQQFKAFVAPLIRDKAKKVSFDLNIAADVPQYIVADSLRLNQIIRNLLSNSAKFTDSGLIKLEVELLANKGNAAEVAFTVSDTGIGIPEDKVQKIFEGFTQADVSITRKYGGTGLGTTITKELVELFESKLEVRSVVGVGTTFRFAVEFALPEASAVDELENRKKMSQAKVSKIQNKEMSVLVADDYQLNQTLLKSYLHIEGIDCDIANNGLEAVELSRKKDYSLIFMDVQMPKMNGHDATREIRSDSLSQKAYIIGISADASKQAEQECFNAGFDAVLNKPIKRMDFINLISSLKK